MSLLISWFLALKKSLYSHDKISSRKIRGFTIHIPLTMYLSKTEGVKIKMSVCIEELVGFPRMNHKASCWLLAERACKCTCKTPLLAIAYSFSDLKHLVLYLLHALLISLALYVLGPANIDPCHFCIIFKIENGDFWSWDRIHLSGFKAL